MKIVTAAEMREIDRLTTERFSVPSLTLMENAGTAVAEFAQKHFEFKTVCVVCGKGNNGGDGLVAARKLHEAGKQVSVIVLAKSGEELRGDAAEMFKKLALTPIWASEEADFDKAELQQALKAELIVDAILGTGFKPPIKGVAEKAVVLINELDHAQVLAIDVPSGIDADIHSKPARESVFVGANAIISFTAPKPALVYAELTDGPIAVAQIGSPVNLVVSQAELNQDVLTAQEFQSLKKKREPDDHKGVFGHVLIIGGSVGKAGAAAMAGLAALRVGAGLVTVACPKSVQPTIAAFAPELMTEPLDETDEGSIAVLALRKREELLAGKTLIVIGPGLSRNKETEEFIRDFVGICPVHMVIDADGLNAFEGSMEELQPDESSEMGLVRVLTPHPGEMARLLGIESHAVQASRIRMALRAATQSSCTVVLKGNRSVVASPSGYVWINTTGNPGMAKGGSGDVLSGILGGMLVQNPHIPGMLGWRAEVDADQDIGFPAIQGIFNFLTKNQTQVEIQKLAEEYKKSNNPALREQIQSKMHPQLIEFLGLLGSLHVARGVFLHGLAGDVARDLVGEDSMIASDIIESLGEALAVCEAEAGEKFAYIQR
ncbi:MAG TPA: NAD(P)H-hydrate dehydratase [Candidatus Limnocylindrales bacterium]|nr:NAD(P)H-hydrate dehydratase [Candidatus Limnocylindrales bacterium]